MTEAERLADLFELEQDPESLYRVAAAELRRLSKIEADNEALRRLIADDGYAMTFQTMGQYRTALLKAMAARPGGQG